MRQNRTALISLAILLTVLSIFFYQGNIAEFPAHIHAWTQSDRYAIALGFLKNHFNFFHPQTFNLNPDFAKTTYGIPTAITAVDFPIHEYIIALLMKITGSSSPEIFRLYVLLYGCVGIFFLFLFVKKLTGSTLSAFTIAVFTFTCPVLCYYQDGFLPSTTSLANVFIGVYFYYSYLTSEKKKYFYNGIGFLTLAALCRIPFTLFLLAAGFTELFTSLRKKNREVRTVTVFLIGLLFVFLYYQYNSYLRHTYGSIFLSNPLPPNSFHELLDILKAIYKGLFFQYFSVYHYMFMLLVLVLFILTRFKNKSSTQVFNNPLLIFIVISGLGATLYAILMLKQYTVHDYYFIDSFFPVIIIAIAYFSKVFAQFKSTTSQIASIVAIAAFSLSFTLESKEIQNSRRETGDWDRIEITTKNFRHSAEFLDSLKIPRTSKILVIDSYTTNIPFILMDRMGFCVMNTTAENIKKSLTYPFDYIVMQDQFLYSDVVYNYPQIINMLERIGGNGKISVFRKLPQERKGNIIELLGIENMKPEFSCFINFDTTLVDSSVSNCKHLSTLLSHSAPNSALLDSITEFGLTIKRPYKQSAEAYAFIRGYYYMTHNIGDCFIVAQLTSKDGQSLNYQKFNLKDYLDSTNHWSYKEFVFALPPVTDNDCTLGIYFWNSSKSTLYYDDIKATIY